MADQKKKKNSGGKSSGSNTNTAKPKSALMAQAEAKANKIVNDRDRSKSKKSGGSSQKGGIVKYLKDLKSEIKKVTWPSKSKIINNTGVVLFSMCVCGIVVWGIDSGLAALLKLAMG